MPLELEILIATMYRSDLKFLEQMFPDDYRNYNLLIVNQTEKGTEINEQNLPSNIRVFNVYEKGLSKSRNLALRHARKDVLLLADDDIRYLKDFDKRVLEAHEKRDAKVLIFPIVDEYGHFLGAYENSEKPLTDFKMVFSPQISLKKDLIKIPGIFFDEKFGLGARFPDAENYVFLKNLAEKGISVYFVKTEPIATHSRVNSSYFLERNPNFETRLMLIKKYNPHLLFFYFTKMLLFLLLTGRISPKEIPEKWQIYKRVSKSKLN